VAEVTGLLRYSWAFAITALSCITAPSVSETGEGESESGAASCPTPEEDPWAIAPIEQRVIEVDGLADALFVVDLDSDGRDEVLIDRSGADALLWQSGEVEAVGGGSATRTIAGDLVGDANADLVAGTQGGMLRVAPGLGPGFAAWVEVGTPVAGPVSPRGVVRDAAGAGGVVAATDSGVVVFVGDFSGAAGPLASVTLEAASEVTSIAVGDLFASDESGASEIVIGRPGSTGNNIGVWRFDGASMSSERVAEFEAGGSPETVRAIDVNLDGALDVAVSTTQGSIVVALGDGEGAFSSIIDSEFEPRLVSFAFAPLDCDAALDVWAVDFASGTFSFVARGFGTGGFSAEDVALGSDTFSVASADLDGDGLQEVVALSPDSVSVWGP
jgi:hypothetical protein